MKIPKSVDRIIGHKYFYYFILFLAATNLIGYLVKGQIQALIFFVLITFGASMFSKNMVLILVASILLTNIFMISSINNRREGMEGGMNDVDTLKQKVDDAQKALDTEKTNTPADKTKIDAAQKAVDDATAKLVEAQKSAATAAAPTTTTTTTTTAGAGAGATGMVADNIEKLKKTLGGGDTTPSTVSAAPEKKEAMNGMGGGKKGGSRIDYAATVEDAYGDLNKILGGDGIKSLTKDTQNLMSQQLQLADAMKSMGPMLESAKSMLDGFDMGNLGKLGDFAKSFTAGGGG